MSGKETFHIKFQMNNGKHVDIDEIHDASYDFHSVLKMQKDRWYKSGNQIINLDNVNSIRIETESEREENKKRLQKQNEETLEALSSIDF